MAATELLRLHECAVGKIKTQQWVQRIDRQATPEGGINNRVRARQDYRAAMEQLDFVTQAVLEAVVVEGKTFEQVAELSTLNVIWLPASARNKAVAAVALFGAGLDKLAITFRI